MNLSGSFLQGGKIYCYANFCCYGNFSIVFGKNFRGKSLGEGRLLQGAPLPHGKKPDLGISVKLYTVVEHIYTVVCQ